jgi:cell division topological specificity factor
LREEILAVVAKHVAIDPSKVEVKLERDKAVSILEIDVEVPIQPKCEIASKDETEKAA